VWNISSESVCCKVLLSDTVCEPVHALLLLLWTLQLSPALRNRFTEIWCPRTFDKNDLVDIIAHNFVKGVAACDWFQQCSAELPRVLGTSMIDFTDWFQGNDFGKR